MACVGEGGQSCAGTLQSQRGMPWMKTPAEFSAEPGLPHRLSLPAPLCLRLQPPALLSVQFTQRCSCAAPHPGSGQVTLSLCLSGTHLHMVFPACLLPGCSGVTRQPWCASESFVSLLSPLLLPGPHLWSPGGGEGSRLIPPSRSCCGF